MQDLENILNQALDRLHQGSSPEEIASNWPKNPELLSYLQTAQSLARLPKNTVPQPAMQRKFMLQPVKRFWLAWLPFSPILASSLSFVLIVSAITGYAALNSVPGQTLFALKRSAEHLRIQMAFNQEDKLNLQVEIAQRRLVDARQVLQNPDSKPQQEQAAIAELLAETKTSIDSIDSATKKNPEPGQSHPLVASLENITAQQQSLLKQIKPKGEDVDLTKRALTASQENSNKVTEIKKYLQAASNEQALTQLADNPDVVAISGNVTQYSKGKITVEKTIFNLNEQTVIKNTDNNLASTSSLSSQARVSVIGSKQENNQLLAQQVVILGPALQATSTKVGSENSSSTPKASGLNSSTTITIKKTGDNTFQKAGSTDKQADPNTATGSFIIEDPSPQSPF